MSPARMLMQAQHFGCAAQTCFMLQSNPRTDALNAANVDEMGRMRSVWLDLRKTRISIYNHDSAFLDSRYYHKIGRMKIIKDWS